MKKDEPKTKKTANPKRGKSTMPPALKTKKKITKPAETKKKATKLKTSMKKEPKKAAAKKSKINKAVTKDKRGERAKKTASQKETIKKPSIAKIRLEKPKKLAMPKKTVPGIPARTIKRIEKDERELPAAPKKTYPPATYGGKSLPSEYGENRITLMTVDPWKLFAYWEVTENSLLKANGRLVLRVYDITGIHFDGSNANITFDIPVYDRIGDGYIGVGPGREFIVDIGIITKERVFFTIAKSNKVKTPGLKISKEEGVLPQEMYEVSHTVGYF